MTLCCVDGSLKGSGSTVIVTPVPADMLNSVYDIMKMCEVAGVTPGQY